MEKLTIHAATPASAREMIGALSEFRPEMVSADGHHEIVVSLGEGRAEIVAVLDALEEYLTEQATGPIGLELDGRRYVMQPGGNAT